MSFDADHTEHAKISSADFAQMCDEMKRLRDAKERVLKRAEAIRRELVQSNKQRDRLKEINAELLDVVQRCELWLSTANARAMQLVCQAVIEKASAGKEGA